MIPAEWFTIAAQSTLLLAMAFLIALVLRRNCAALRHQVWTLALALPLLLPFWPEEVLRVDVPVSPAVTRITVGGKAPAGPSIDPTRTLYAIWVAGCVALLGRIALGQLRVWRMMRRARTWRPGICLSTEISVPIAAGLWAPRVLLPGDAVQWPAARLVAVLSHERMHLERRDLWWQLLAQIACAVYWPNPLVWFAASQHHRECEQACDDGVLASGIAPTDYANDLIEIARGLTPRTQLKGGLAMATPTTLEHRLHALLNPLTSHRPVSRRSAFVTVGLGLVLLAPIAGIRLTGQVKQDGLFGVVVDPSGAAIEKARISLQFPHDLSRREVIRTNQNGEFRFPQLPGGLYRIRVEKPGFAVLEQSELRVEDGKPASFKFTMNLGRIQESIQVGARLAVPPPPPPPPPSGAKTLIVGGNVQAAKLISQVTPIYPADCKAERIEGIVVLNAVIGKDGAVIGQTPAAKFVDSRLQKAAVDAVQLWRYQPTLLNGEPVEIQTQIEVNFTLAN